MATDGTLKNAVSVLTHYGGHNRESARRFLGRCTVKEIRSLAAAADMNEFEEAVGHVLDRLERNDTGDRHGRGNKGPRRAPTNGRNV